MEFVFELLKIVIPSLIVFLTTFFVLRSYTENTKMAFEKIDQTISNFLQVDIEMKKLQAAHQAQETILPLRLQAYERMTLFCSRIELLQLLFRVYSANAPAREVRLAMLANIEEEYNHNITQQVYMSDELWKMVQIAKTEAAKIVETVGKSLPAEASGKDFSEALRLYLEHEPQLGYIQAQVGIKREVQVLFA